VRIPRRVWRGVGAAFVAWLTCVRPASAQTATPTDSDPTRPIFFSIRPEFYRIADQSWRSLLIARYDQAVVRRRRWFSGKRGLLLRFEAPLAVASTAPGDTSAGLGDLYGQVLLVPLISGRFGVVAGTGLSIPTATNARLGSGKWTLAPVVAPLWFMPGGGLAYLKVQEFMSIAGAADRADVNFLLVTPTVIRRVGRSSWILADTETRTDWQRDGTTSVKSGIQFGRILPDGIGLWVKPEIWWSRNQGGEWNLKTGLVWYR
jgi:hypothetical protein